MNEKVTSPTQRREVTSGARRMSTQRSLPFQDGWRPLAVTPLSGQAMNLQAFLARVIQEDMFSTKILSVCRVPSLGAERIKILRAAGYQVDDCTDSAVAIQKIKSVDYDLVVLGHSDSHPEDTLVAQTAHFSNVPVLMLANGPLEGRAAGDSVPAKEGESMLHLVKMVLNLPVSRGGVM